MSARMTRLWAATCFLVTLFTAPSALLAAEGGSGPELAVEVTYNLVSGVPSNQFVNQWGLRPGGSLRMQVDDRVFIQALAQPLPSDSSLSSFTRALLTLSSGAVDPPPVAVSRELLFVGLSGGVTLITLPLAGVLGCDLSLLAGAGAIQMKTQGYLGYSSQGGHFAVEPVSGAETEFLPAIQIEALLRFPIGEYAAIELGSAVFGYRREEADYTAAPTLDQDTGAAVYPLTDARRVSHLTHLGLSVRWPGRVSHGGEG